MPAVKINHIVNLQDARYCAAMGTELITFCLERGNLHKVAANTVQEIQDWLSGPQVILDFGADLDGLHEWLQTYPDEQRLLQASIPGPGAALPSITRHQLVLLLPLHEADDRYVDQLITLATQCAYLEVQPTQNTPALQRLLQRLIEDTFNLVINLDSTGPDLLAHLPQRPYAISFRAIASVDDFELDYDKTEALVEAFQAV